MKKASNIADQIIIQIMIGGLRAANRTPCKQGQHRLRAHDAVEFAGIVPLSDEGGLREEYQGPSPVPGRIRLLRGGPLADCLRCVRSQRAGGGLSATRCCSWLCLEAEAEGSGEVPQEPGTDR